MKLRNLFMILTLAVALGACDKKEEEAAKSGDINCQTAFIDLSQNEFQVLLDAQTAYGTSDTKADCDAYVKATENYIAAVEAAVAKCTDPVASAQLTALNSGLTTWKGIVTQLKVTCAKK
jgi:hypothetical protein